MSADANDALALWHWIQDAGALVRPHPHVPGFWICSVPAIGFIAADTPIAAARAARDAMHQHPSTLPFRRRHSDGRG